MLLGVTRTDISRNVTSAPAEAIPGHVRGMGDNMARQRDTQEIMDNIGHELAQVRCHSVAWPSRAAYPCFTVLNCRTKYSSMQAPAGDIPPYPMWYHGKYSGWLWTLDPTKFDRTDVRHLIFFVLVCIVLATYVTHMTLCGWNTCIASKNIFTCADSGQLAAFSTWKLQVVGKSARQHTHPCQG